MVSVGKERCSYTFRRNDCINSLGFWYPSKYMKKSIVTRKLVEVGKKGGKCEKSVRGKKNRRKEKKTKCEKSVRDLNIENLPRIQFQSHMIFSGRK